MELDDAAREIYQAIRKRKRIHRFPWQLSMISESNAGLAGCAIRSRCWAAGQKAPG